MKLAPRTVLLIALVASGVSTSFAKHFDQEKNDVRLTIEKVEEAKYVIEQPQQVTAAGVITLSQCIPISVTVANNSDKAMVISAKSFRRLPLIEAKRIGRAFRTFKGELALWGSILGFYGTGFAGAYGMKNAWPPASLKIAVGSALFAIICLDYAVRKGSKPYIDAFEKTTFNDDAITIAPGEKLEKLIFLDVDGYNTKEFDVRLHAADNKSEVTAFHVVDWH